jgi:hypothetical protein
VPDPAVAAEHVLVIALNRLAAFGADFFGNVIHSMTTGGTGQVQERRNHYNTFTFKVLTSEQVSGTTIGELTPPAQS